LLWQAFGPTQPFGVATDPCPGGKAGCRHWKIYGLSPILAGGWAIVGEESKYVALSPQRIVSAHATAATTRSADSSDALLESELQPTGGAGLSFTIIGAEAERVRITVLAPAAAVDDSPHGRLAAAMAGKAVVVEATLGASGKADVSCSAGACKVAA
jgi:hypothetical protein